MPEGEVERRVQARAIDLGGRAFKLLPWVQRGLPDRLVVIPGQVWFVETKAPRGRMAGHQRRMRTFIEDLGLNWATLDTREQVDVWYFLRYAEVERWRNGR